MKKETTYFKGDLAEYTGKSSVMHGATFFEVIMLEGHLKGTIRVVTSIPGSLSSAIKYVRTLGLHCGNSGNILSKLPDGERGLTLVNMLEENTMSEDYCYTIINNKIEKIDC